MMLRHRRDNGHSFNQQHAGNHDVSCFSVNAHTHDLDLVGVQGCRLSQGDSRLVPAPRRTLRDPEEFGHTIWTWVKVEARRATRMRDEGTILG